MASNGTAFDAFVAERRIRALWELPWVLPATVVIGMTDEDLDLLYAARDKDEYWRLLRNIVERLERGTPRTYHFPIGTRDTSSAGSRGMLHDGPPQRARS
jgi:hypothetical protein